MQPLEELLHRIRWDANFGRGAFAIGYYDRVKHQEQRVPFEVITIDAKGAGTFSLEDEDGAVHRIPFHRVRTVYRDGVAVWQRR